VSSVEKFSVAKGQRPSEIVYIQRLMRRCCFL
ncbi:uncharacterized protein METZ01_LOCUS357547, partial [marine metagenome]